MGPCCSAAGPDAWSRDSSLPPMYLHSYSSVGTLKMLGPQLLRRALAAQSSNSADYLTLSYLVSLA
jgi:hypothetical protein